MSKADEIRAAEYNYRVASDNFRAFSRIEGRLSRQEEREKYEAERAVEAAARALYKLKAKRNPDVDENKTVKGVDLTIVVEWREAKPPEKAPMWKLPDGEGKYRIREIVRPMRVSGEHFISTMTTPSGADKALGFVQRLIEHAAKGKTAWLVHAWIRLGSADRRHIDKLPVLLKTSYWTLKHGNFGVGPGRNWTWGRIEASDYRESKDIKKLIGRDYMYQTVDWK